MDDSKRLFGTKRGRGQVEAVLLGALAAAEGDYPATIRDWLKLDADPKHQEILASLPWYGSLDQALPRWTTIEAIEEARQAADNGELVPGLGIEGFALSVVAAPRFNEAVLRCGNKHLYLFELVCGLIDGMPSAATRRLTVDRLGGRKFYADGLGAQFPFRAIEVLSEAKGKSAYRADLEGGMTEISFAVGADAEHPEVSLASMAAKYSREILMEVFNAHWAGRVADLRPTAGYYTDGCRFLDDLESAGVLPVDRGLLVRER